MRVETMSYSFMEAFLRCPLQHHFKYSDKKEPRVTDETNLRFGQLVHSVLENIRKSGMNIDDATAQAIKDMEFDVLPSMITDAKDLVKIWLKSADMSGMVAQTEWHFDRPLLGKNFRMNGYIDLIENMPDGTMRITDYKTGYTIYTYEDLQNSLQLLMYAVVAFDEWHPAGIEICYDMIRMCRITYRITKLDIIRTIDRIERIRSMIEACTDPKPKLGAHCGYCAYNHHCKAFLDLKDMSKDALVIPEEGNVEGMVRGYNKIYQIYKATEARKDQAKALLEGFMTENNRPVIDLGDVRAKMRFSTSLEYNPVIVTEILSKDDLPKVISVEKRRMDDFIKGKTLSEAEASTILNQCRNVPRRPYVVVEEI